MIIFFMILVCSTKGAVTAWHRRPTSKSRTHFLKKNGTTFLYNVLLFVNLLIIKLYELTKRGCGIA